MRFAKSWFVVARIIVNILCFTPIARVDGQTTRTASGAETIPRGLVIALVVIQAAANIILTLPIVNVLAQD